MEGEDYYSSLARRVYFIAEVEDWDYHTTVKMLNDKEGFERFYENWRKKELRIEEKVPKCVNRLMLDSQQRIAQKIRDENQKRIKEQVEEERIVKHQAKIAKKRKATADGKVRRFDKFMEDQIIHQTKRYEKLKAAMIEENSKVTHVPQISSKSRILMEKKENESPERASIVYSRLAEPTHGRTQSRASMKQLPENNKNIYGKEGGLKKGQNPFSQSQRLFSPLISKKAAKKKREGKVEDELYKDGLERAAKRRQAEYESVKQELEQAGPLQTEKTAKKTEDLLLSRFYRDLENVYEQFEIDDKTEISEVTMTEIMVWMGFVMNSDISQLDAVQSIWHHLQPSTGQQEESKQPPAEGNPDNGERVVAEHLKIFMAAILGFHIGAHAESNNGNPDLIGTLDETTGEYMLSSAEAKKVHKRYHQLSVNHMDHQMQQRREQHRERGAKLIPQTEAHKPKLDKKSLEIARAKAPPKTKKQQYADYLIQRGKDYEMKRQSLAQEMLDEKDGVAECTFKPAINNVQLVEESPGSKAKGSKWDQLYQSGVERVRKQENKTTEQIEWEKSKTECKFAPEVHEINLIGGKKPIVAQKPKPGSVAKKMRNSTKPYSPAKTPARSPAKSPKNQSRYLTTN